MKAIDVILFVLLLYTVAIVFNLFFGNGNVLPTAFVNNKFVKSQWKESYSNDNQDSDNNDDEADINLDNYLQKSKKKLDKKEDDENRGGYYMGNDDGFMDDTNNIDSYNIKKKKHDSYDNKYEHYDNDENTQIKKKQEQWIKEITILIKTFNRYKPATELIISVNKFYPNLRIIVADDGILNQQMHYRKFRKTVQYYKLKYDLGLSFGRNYLVKKAKTKYVVILDDDFQFVKNTTLYKLYDLHKTIGADIVSGKLDDRHAFGARMERLEEKKRIKIIEEQRPNEIDSTECWQTQRVLNFFLAKRSFLLKNPWENRLKLEEQ